MTEMLPFVRIDNELAVSIVDREDLFEFFERDTAHHAAVADEQTLNKNEFVQHDFVGRI